MNKQPVFRRTLIAAATALALLGASGMARAVDEMEPNGSIAQGSITNAQRLTVGADGSITVTGAITSGDVDFFSFYAEEGNTVVLDIEGASFDTHVFLFGPGIPTFFENDDGDSAVSTDSYLVHTVGFGSTGIFTVGVAPYGTQMNASGADPTSPSGTAGSYTLVISGASPFPTSGGSGGGGETPPPPPPLAEQINIDVRSSAHALQHGKHKDQITVALLASPSFNPAADVDVSSLSFGLTGDERSLKRCDRHEERDGKKGHERRRHLVCHFNADTSGLDVGNTYGVLKGRTTNGTLIEGKGSLKVGKPKKGPRHARVGN